MPERAKVLVVEDDQDLLEDFRSLLSSEYDVVTAKDGGGTQKVIRNHI